MVARPSTRSRPSTPARVAGMIAWLYALTFLVAALLHTGVRVSLGFAVLSEPVIVPAVIVETLCGVGLAVSGYGLLAGRPWAWRGAVLAHAFALAGVLLGIVAVAAGGGPSTPLNDAYHATMALLLATGLVLLLTPVARALR